jgi:CBS domain containing-hemolysin-like protein
LEEISISTKVIGIIALVLFAGFLSGIEAAIFFLDRWKIKHGSIPKAKVIEKLLRKPPELLATILLGILLCNIVASSLATSIAINLCRDTGINEAVGVGVAIGIMTFVILVFAEVGPITFAVMHAEKFSQMGASTLEIFYTLVNPIVKCITWVVNLFLRLIEKTHLFKKEGPLSLEEIKLMMKVGQEEGAIKKEEKRFIDRIFGFEKTKVSQIMTPFDQVIAVNIDSSPKQVLKIVRETGHSRLPVYEGTKDNIVGLLLAKDFLPFIGKNKNKVQIRDLIREIYWVSDDEKVNELLQKLRKEKTHMCMVKKDEKVIGMVTMEDVIEEIVGEIEDEYDVD